MGARPASCCSPSQRDWLRATGYRGDSTRPEGSVGARYRGYGMDSLHWLGRRLPCSDDQQSFEGNSDFERIERHDCLLLEIRSGVERICAARDWAIRRPPPPPDTAAAGDFVCGQHTSCGPFTEAAEVEVHPRPMW